MKYFSSYTERIHIIFAMMALVATALVSAVFFVPSAQAAETRSYTQSTGYKMWWEYLNGTSVTAQKTGTDFGDKGIVPIASGQLSIVHNIQTEQSLDNICVGDTVEFLYDPEIAYNATGGVWDTPYGQWCDNTVQGCDIDFKKNQSQYTYFGHDGYDAWMHWTGEKANVNMQSKNKKILDCKGNVCTVVGEGSVQLRADISETTTEAWNVLSSNLSACGFLGLTGGKVFGLNRSGKGLTTADIKSMDALSLVFGAAGPCFISPSHDKGSGVSIGSYDGQRMDGGENAVSLDFEIDKWEYLFSGDPLEGGGQAKYFARLERDYENRETKNARAEGHNVIFKPVTNSKDLTWTVTASHCEEAVSCGTKHGQEAATWEQVIGTKCSDGSNPAITVTPTGWNWTCGANTPEPVQCSATKIDGPDCGSAAYIGNAATKPVDNLCHSGTATASAVTGNGMPWRWTCTENNIEKACWSSCFQVWDVATQSCQQNSCTPPEIVDPNDPTQCCLDEDNDGTCDTGGNPDCGSAAYIGNAATKPVDNLCLTGTASAVTGNGMPWSWTCTEKNTEKACWSTCFQVWDVATQSCQQNSCTPPEIVDPNDPTQCCLDEDNDGTCDGDGPEVGPDCNQTTLTAPPTRLCNKGTLTDPPGLTGTGTPTDLWTWTCSLNGLKSNVCTAQKDTVTPPACGSAHTTTTVTPPTTNLCANGTASAVTGTGYPWSWTCSENGQSLSCGASCPEPTFPSQVNLLRTGGAEPATITVPQGVSCDIDGVWYGSKTDSVKVEIPITSHPTDVKNRIRACICSVADPRPPQGCPAGTFPYDGNKCCDQDDWNPRTKECGTRTIQGTIQCVCTAKKCSSAGTCVATPVIASSYSSSACSSECSSNADCSSGNIIETR